RQRQEIEALARDNSRLAEIAATQVNLLIKVAEAEYLRGNVRTALKLWVLAARRDVETQRQNAGHSHAAAALAVAVCQTDWRLVLSGHEGSVNSAAFSPDGLRIVTASDDKTARIWNAVTGQEIATLRAHDLRVQSAAFSPDGSRIVTASWDATA